MSSVCNVAAFYESQDSNDLDSSNDTESNVTYDPHVDIEDDEDDAEQTKPALRFKIHLNFHHLQEFLCFSLITFNQKIWNLIFIGGNYEIN